MLKSTAIHALGGIKSAAESIGVTQSAIHQWPELLPKRLEDRVIAAIARKRMPELVRALQADNPAA